MQPFSWDWWLHTDAGLLTRVAAGVLIFVVLAAWDLARHGRHATRWREYLFLLGAVLAAMVYGVVNDQITVTISPEYFLYFKGLANELDPRAASEPAAIRWGAARIGLMATWSAGLIAGVAILVANNPRRGRPQLPHRHLWRWLPVVFTVAAGCAAMFGLLGYLGVFARIIPDFAEMVRTNQFRPPRLMATYGIHLGGYVGGAIGTLIAVVGVVRRRRLQCPM